MASSTDSVYFECCGHECSIALLIVVESSFYRLEPRLSRSKISFLKVGNPILLHRLYTCTRILACFVFVCAPGQAQSTPEAAVQTFKEAFNSGEAARAAAVTSHTGISIIDEFASYTWTGAKAFDNRRTAFEANSKAFDITEAKVTLSAPRVKNVTATQAYLIYPSLYEYKQKGIATREIAHMAIVLRKEGPTWKFTAWVWTGTVPKVAN